MPVARNTPPARAQRPRRPPQPLCTPLGHRPGAQTTRYMTFILRSHARSTRQSDTLASCGLVAELEALSLAEMARAEGWAKITPGSDTPPRTRLIRVPRRDRQPKRPKPLGDQPA